MGTTESILANKESGETNTQTRPNPNSYPPRRYPSRNKSPGAGSTTKRPRPPPLPIKRITGLVLGGPKSGKRVLLQRLQGNDPYASDGNEKEEQPKKLATMVNIAYQPQQTYWDRIQLQVQATRKIPLDRKLDFAIILIHPKHPFERTRTYLIHTLSAILMQLGYERQQIEKEEGYTKTTVPSSQEPICLCLLYNFRDLKHMEPSQQQVFRNLVKDLIFGTFQVPRDKVVLQLAETCLRNCYGLNVLHHFIYQAYLQRKQTDLRRQLDQVRAQINQTDDEPLSMTYQNFVQNIDPEIQPPYPQKPHRSSSKRVTFQESPVPQQLLPSPVEKQPPTPQSQGSPPEQQKQQQQYSPPLQEQPTMQLQRGERRPVLSSKQQPSPMRFDKDALEAFLASSSDEEEEDQKIRRSFAVDSSEDENDDFFYDEGGNQRFNHNTYGNRSMSSDSNNSSKDTETEELPRTRKDLIQAYSTKSSSPGKKTISNGSKPVNFQNNVESERKQRPEDSRKYSGAGPKPLNNNDSKNQHIPEMSESSDDEAEDKSRQSPSHSSSVTNNESRDMTISSSEKDIDEDSFVVDNSMDKIQSDPSVSLKQDSMIFTPHPTATTTTTSSSSSSTNVEGDDDKNKFVSEKEASYSSLPKKRATFDDDSDDNSVMTSPTPPPVSQSEAHQTPESNNDDSDDDEFFVGEEAVIVVDDSWDDDEDVLAPTNSIPRQMSSFPVPPSDTDEDQDDCEEGVGVEEVDSWDDEDTLPTQQQQQPQESSPRLPSHAPLVPTEASISSGISTAALAAIAVAQKEAETMLLQQQQQLHHSALMVKVKKKKKKDKTSKKEKKKKRQREID